jgi:hypothetical protein
VSGERLSRGGIVSCEQRHELFLPEERRRSDKGMWTARLEADAFMPGRVATGERRPARPIMAGRVAAQQLTGGPGVSFRSTNEWAR